MKKVLSFVLVLAMILGSVGMVSAKDYTDQAAITNKEAVAVLSELKVLEGDANGFRPADTLTRAEAAAIIARLVLGRAEADKLAAATTMFSDVPASHWAAGYINYCVNEGIIAGNGDGTFAPSGLLTVPAFQKMVLCALGYSATKEGLVGSGWEAATASLAVKAGITVNATGNCTRETAALIGLKGLESDVVWYEQAEITVNTGGAQVVVGGSSAKKVEVKDGAAGTAPMYDDKADGIQQLAEKVYKKDLKKADDTDAFGRTATKWTYKGEKIGTYGDVDDADKIYTAKTTETVVKNNYKAADITATDGAVYVNNVVGTTGAIVSLADIASLTHNGRTVELYKKDGKVTKIVAYDQFLAKVQTVNTSSEKNTYKIQAGVNNFKPTVQPTTKGYGAYVKDDYVIITVAKDGANWEVQSVAPATKLNGVISNLEVEDTNYAKTITLDGTTYTAAYHSIEMNRATDKAYDVYTNADGIAFYAPESSATQDYLVLTANAGTVNDSLGKPSTVGQVVLMDGTIKTVTLKAGSPTTAGIYAYTISSNEYNLTTAGMKYADYDTAETFTNKVTKVVGTIYGGANYFSDTTTVYVIKDEGQEKAKVTTYTGAQKFTAAVGGVYFVTDKDITGGASATIKTAVILSNGAKVKNTSTDWVYANKSTAVGATMVGSNSKSQYEVYIKGVKTVVTAESAPTAFNFYEPTTDSDGVYTWGAAENTANLRVVNTSIAAAYAGNIQIAGLNAGNTTKVAEDVIVVDLRPNLYDDEKMTTFDEIQDYLADYTDGLRASAVYDENKDKEVVTHIFLTAGTPQHSATPR